MDSAAGHECLNNNSINYKVSTGVFSHLHPADWIFIVFCLFLAGASIYGSGSIANWWIYPPIFIGIIAVVLGIIKLNLKINSKIVRFIRYWYPLFGGVMLFSGLGLLVPYVNSAYLADKGYYVEKLQAIDRWIFGVDPVVALEKIRHPLLTDWLQLSYCSYYVMPIVLGLLLYLKGRMRDYRMILAVILAGVFTSYVGYFFVPANAPRFNIDSAVSTEPVGIIVRPLISPMIDGLEPLQLDCFPSGHTEVTVLTLLMAFIYTRKAFWVMLPFGLSLIFATVYLRYHYVIDVIAGLAFAAGVIAVVPLFVKWLEKRHKKIWEQNVVKEDEKEIEIN